MPTITRTKDNWAIFFFATASACATLWDFRFHNIRIFDISGLIFLFAFFWLQWTPLSTWLQSRREVLFFYGILIFYAALGLILHNHRSSFAIIALGLVGFALNGQREWLSFHALFRCLIILHMAFFFVQFGAFYIIGETFDLHQYFGEPTHNIRNATEIRASGLFREPNSYCINLFLLTTLATLQKSSRLIVFLSATTMVLSQSLWGFGAAGILILMSEAREATFSYRIIKTYIVMLVLLGTIFNIYLWAIKPASDQLPYFYSRIINLYNDQSFRDRYIGRKTGDYCDATEHPKILVDSGDPILKRLPFWMFGEGLTTSYFLQCLPANGVAFFFKSFGILGLSALVFGLSQALRKASLRDRVFVAVTIIFSLTTYPLITYLIFWIWLAGLIGVANENQAPLTAASAPSVKQRV